MRKTTITLAALLVGVVLAADVQAGFFMRRHRPTNVHYYPAQQRVVPADSAPRYMESGVRSHGRPYMPEFWRDVDGYGES